MNSIKNWTDLNDIQNDLSGDYLLVNDLDENTQGYVGIGDDFTPIGTEEEPFTGLLDGQEYEIKDLKIDFLYRNVGLIGYSERVIKNIGVVNVDVTGSRYVGGLVGQNRGEVRDSYATGDVEGDNRVGGLVGFNMDKIVSSYAKCTVISKGIQNDAVGGLVGNNGEGEVKKSYATGDVTGEDKLGGLVGRQGTGKIFTSYSTGNVIADGDSNVGGLIGENPSFGTVNDSYWDTESSGITTSDGGAGLTTDKMQGEDNELTGFKSPPWIFQDEEYPILQWQA